MAKTTINQAEMRRLHDEFMKRVDTAAIVVQNEMIDLTTKVDGAVKGTIRRRATGKKVKALRYGTRRSKRGESPYKQTGTLSGSIAIERRPSELRCRIGDGVRYGSILELALDRPHMRKALENKRQEVGTIFGG